ncbi:MAG: MoxR family ATPase [Nitrospinota bacterium]|jgi:MoxR-like ATPase|nr:MoxR family ATPase [Nitrospinota bacterium]MDP6618768.1 MoxR family ATPase [Nitrospinota bacterium]
MFDSIENLQEELRKQNYIADRTLATTLYLSTAMKKPIFLEGEAGVGKTDVAKVLAQITDSKLIRLQCYEGLDVNTSLYEWNYAKQLLRIKMEEGSKGAREALEETIFSSEFLIARPLLEAIQDGNEKSPVLLIDEVDRSDEEFEAFLLEVLADFQISIPEIGTITAKHKPYVILTSNRTRDVHDALKRRCLYLWIDYPTFEKELEIVTVKMPGIGESLARQICNLMQGFREVDFYKKPGIAETLDWATALVTLHKKDLDSDAVNDTLGAIFKYQEDVIRAKDEAVPMLMKRYAGE